MQNCPVERIRTGHQQRRQSQIVLRSSQSDDDAQRSADSFIDTAIHPEQSDIVRSFPLSIAGPDRESGTTQLVPSASSACSRVS